MILTQFFLPPNRFVLLFPSFQLNLLLSFHSGGFVHPINSPLVPFKCPALSKILNVMSSFVKCVSNVIEENLGTTFQLLLLWSYPFRMNRVKINDDFYPFAKIKMIKEYLYWVNWSKWGCLAVEIVEMNQVHCDSFARFVLAPYFLQKYNHGQYTITQTIQHFAQPLISSIQ